MRVRITYFFESVQAAPKYASAALGWTETWYAQSNMLNDLDSWLFSTDLNAYGDLRRPCLSDNYRLAWVRVSDEDNPRSFKIGAVTAGWGTAREAATSGGEPVGIRGQVTCALLVDLARLPDNPTDHTHHRKFLMRALPVDIIDGNVINTAGANWQNIRNFLNWLAFRESGTGVMGLLPPGIVANTTIGLKYQNPANAAWTVAPHVQLSGTSPRAIAVSAQLAGTPLMTDYDFRDFPDNVRAINRRWRLLNSTGGPPAVSVLGRTRRDLPEGLDYVPPGPGRYRQVVPTYNLFSQYTIIGLRLKKTGRLFRQLRGRSSNR